MIHMFERLHTVGEYVRVHYKSRVLTPSGRVDQVFPELGVAVLHNEVTRTRTIVNADEVLQIEFPV